MNTAKDFTRNTIEVIITGPPGGFAFVEGAELTLWEHGAKTFFTSEMVRYTCSLLKCQQKLEIVFEICLYNATIKKNTVVLVSNTLIKRGQYSIMRSNTN